VKLPPIERIVRERCRAIISPDYRQYTFPPRSSRIFVPFGAGRKSCVPGATGVVMFNGRALTAGMTRSAAANQLRLARAMIRGR
jgi:hypothetical protein